MTGSVGRTSLRDSGGESNERHEFSRLTRGKTGMPRSVCWREKSGNCSRRGGGMGGWSTASRTGKKRASREETRRRPDSQSFLPRSRGGSAGDHDACPCPRLFDTASMRTCFQTDAPRGSTRGSDHRVPYGYRHAFHASLSWNARLASAC